MTLSRRFQEALVHACELHADQTRKGSGVPYVAHLLAVTSIALEYGASEDEAIAAVLHDAVEDQGGRAVGEEIRRRFGDAVADIVYGCSDTDVQPKPPWRERKESYLAHLAEAPGPVLLVSAADKLHNVRSIARDYREHGEEIWNRFQGRRDGTLWYYETVADALLRRHRSQLTRDLQDAVDELQALAGSGR
jgi:(p)ppGpp synthase/HD superfamily hydrolase